jgi:hypothetical protein
LWEYVLQVARSARAAAICVWSTAALGGIRQNTLVSEKTTPERGGDDAHAGTMLRHVNTGGALHVISDEVACPATLRRRWHFAVQSSLLNVRINPGSPVFLATARHLQEALAILANLDPLAAVAALAGLGVLVACSRLGLS